MTFTFTKATKTQRKLRMALMGPSGSGKTFSALQFATELAQGGTIALLDTERGSASLYSDRFNFDACEIGKYDPENYIAAIKAASQAGYSVLVIDSLSHAWAGEGGVLDRVNAASGNKFTDGWGKVGTPLQNQLINAILDAPMHVIATMRVKTEYAVEQNSNGKSVPKRIGLAAVQRDGCEYEFDIIGVMSIDNVLTIEKTRMVELSGKIVPKPTGELAKQILGWLNDGEPEVEIDRAALTTEIITMLRKEGKTDKAIETAQAKLAQMPGRVFMETLAEVRARHEVATDAAETYARRAS